MVTVRRALGADLAGGWVRWYVRGRFRLALAMLAELDRAPSERDPVELRARLRRAARHGHRVLRVRLVVTALLFSGAATAVAAALVAQTGVGGAAAEAVDALDRVATLSGSFAVVFLGLRLALDRHLRLVETCLFLVAAQVAAARIDEPATS